MSELNDKQRNKLLALAKIAEEGDLAVIQKMFEMEDEFENIIEQASEALKQAQEMSSLIERGIQEVAQIKQNTEKGAKGDKGDKGDSIQGKPGKDGRDGRDGIGRDGRDGVDGLDGKDGSPDTADDIRNKLELLTGEDRLDASAIKNLPEATQTVIREQLNVGGWETTIKTSTGAYLTKDGSGAYILPASGAGSAITVKDEGTNLTTALSSLNFVGGGVTATTVGNDVTVTVSGASVNFADNEVVSGSGQTFTLANTPVAGTVKVYAGGIRQKVGASYDYTISGTTITFLLNTYDAGDIQADYQF